MAEDKEAISLGSKTDKINGKQGNHAKPVAIKCVRKQPDKTKCDEEHRQKKSSKIRHFFRNIFNQDNSSTSTSLSTSDMSCKDCYLRCDSDDTYGTWPLECSSSSCSSSSSTSTCSTSSEPHTCSSSSKTTSSRAKVCKQHCCRKCKEHDSTYGSWDVNAAQCFEKYRIQQEQICGDIQNDGKSQCKSSEQKKWSCKETTEQNSSSSNSTSTSSLSSINSANKTICDSTGCVDRKSNVINYTNCQRKETVWSTTKPKLASIKGRCTCKKNKQDSSINSFNTLTNTSHSQQKGTKNQGTATKRCGEISTVSSCDLKQACTEFQVLPNDAREASQRDGALEKFDVVCPSVEDAYFYTHWDC